MHVLACILLRLYSNFVINMSIYVLNIRLFPVHSIFIPWTINQRNVLACKHRQDMQRHLLFPRRKTFPLKLSDVGHLYTLIKI